MIRHFTTKVSDYPSVSIRKIKNFLKKSAPSIKKVFKVLFPAALLDIIAKYS